MTTVAFGQNNDIESQILQYEDSKSTIISKGRNLLTDKFLENDIERVKEIRRYLAEKIEDENYIALYPVENWLVLYWTQEYEDLLKNLNSDNPLLTDGFTTKIRPNRDMLFWKLEEKSIEFADSIREQIKSAALSSEHKDFLLLNFDVLVMDSERNIQTLDSLSFRADEFLNTYPNSEYADFTRKYIRYKFVPKNWGFAYEFFSGYGLFTEGLSRNYTNNVPIGLAYDIFYKKIGLYLQLSVGFNSTKKDFNYSVGTFEKGSATRVYLFEGALGYAVLDNNRFKLSPFAGLGSMSIAPMENDIKKIPQLEELSLDFALTYMIGFNFDIKLGEKNTSPYRPKTNYWFLRIRYAYGMPQFVNKYDEMTGNMHHITIGIGIFTRGTKREY